MNTKHGIVHILLSLCELATNRYGACEIRCIVGVLSSHIEQDELAGVATLLVCDVVEDYVVDSRSNDRCVGKTFRAVADKFMDEFGLDLILIHSRFQIAQYATK